MLNVLLVDDEQLSREMLATYLEGLLGMNVTQAENGVEALKKFDNGTFHLVISDIKMPEMDGHDLLREINKRPAGKNTKVVLITGFAAVDSAVQALRDNAYDYIDKPVDIDRIAEIVRRIEAEIVAAECGSTTGESEAKPKGKRPEFPPYLKNGSYIELPDKAKIGVFSTAMRSIVGMAEKLHKDRSIPVLIEGKSGTGKEMIASFIHHGGGKSDAPLVSVNCSAFSEALFESEFFGYESGAFTGANSKGKIGKLKLADGGTLFLDEIGEMPLAMQPKLLRVIQEKSYYPVGGEKKISLDIRIIAATNRSLKKMAEEGKFREDLLFRLNPGYIQLPLLEAQIEAIAPLAQMFLVDLAQARGKKFRMISKEALKLLENYPWPGNIRELRNTIERAVVLFDEIELRPEHILLFAGDSAMAAEEGRPVFDPANFSLPEDKLHLADLEKDIVEKTLLKFNGNKSKTAAYLGLTLSALRSRLK